VIIGLGFVAAAAKFQAVRPDLMQLLDVGRVQFGALHQIEAVLVPLTCLMLAFGGRRHRICAGMAFAAFLGKAIILQPALHQRMVDRLAGQSVGDSSLHLQYVLASLLVVILLFGASLVREKPIVSRHRDTSTGIDFHQEVEPEEERTLVGVST
jgi:hypothetical protein